MKKLLYSVLFLMAGGCLFTACGDDEDGEVVCTNPASEVEGTYSGTWTMVNYQEKKSNSGTVLDTVNVSSPGYLNLATVSPFLTTATLYAENADAMLQAETNVMSVNITKTANGAYNFFNTAANKTDSTRLLTTTGLSGFISAENVLKTSFSNSTVKMGDTVSVDSIYDKRNKKWKYVYNIGTTTSEITWTFEGTRK